MLWHCARFQSTIAAISAINTAFFLFIKGVVDAHCPDTEMFADLFSGTGAVSSAFQDTHTIITNDILYSNYLANLAWFGAQHYDAGKLSRLIVDFNSIDDCDENYMSENFADTYFSARDSSIATRIISLRTSRVGRSRSFME